MQSVKELDTRLEERSDAFFDENEEERILAEVQRRYQGDGQRNAVAQGSHAEGSAPVSSFGRMPEMLSTEQFMRDMGVMNTDQLNGEPTKAAGPALPSEEQPKFDHVQARPGQFSSDMNMPTDFQYQPQGNRPLGPDANLLGGIGAGIQGASAEAAAQGHPGPGLPQFNARSEELDVAEAVQALNANSSTQIVGPPQHNAGQWNRLENPHGFHAAVNASPQSAMAPGAAATDVQQELRGIGHTLDQLAINEVGHGGLQQAMP